MPPQQEGRVELAKKDVENPFDPGSYETVTVNVRESTLATMVARGQIDDAQFRAGDYIRSRYERSRIGSQAFDPSHEPVDVSGVSDPIPARVLLATKDIVAMQNHVGPLVWRVLEGVCGQGFTITEMASKIYGTNKETDKTFVGRLLREGLDQIAALLGFASPRLLPKDRG